MNTKTTVISQAELDAQFACCDKIAAYWQTKGRTPTQEEFDARVAELYGDVNDLQGQITTHTQTIAQLQGQIKGYETAALKQRIAQEKGIPVEMAARLSGETEKDIRTDADAMAAMIRTIKGPAPLL